MREKIIRLPFASRRKCKRVVFSGARISAHSNYDTSSGWCSFHAMENDREYSVYGDPWPIHSCLSLRNRKFISNDPNESWIAFTKSQFAYNRRAICISENWNLASSEANCKKLSEQTIQFKECVGFCGCEICVKKRICFGGGSEPVERRA